MEHPPSNVKIPIPEASLRDLPKNLLRVIPNFIEQKQSTGVKQLQELVGPILETADAIDITPSHRAAACNAVCAIIEKVQTSDVEYARSSILDDFIWFRLFQIYLQRCDEAKGKSVRQMLLVLTGVLLNDRSPASFELQIRVTSIFVDMICLRNDRLKVRPALQGLSHFLLKNVISLSQLMDIYKSKLLKDSVSRTDPENLQSLFSSFLTWVVHHDTSLSTGHLVKNFLDHLRRSPFHDAQNGNSSTSPLWIKPVISMIRLWPDRIQEFKVHVFPHCFLPNINEYLQLLSYLHFSRHVTTKGTLPELFQAVNEDSYNELESFEEFTILLAVIQVGTEMGIIKVVDHQYSDNFQNQENVIYLPDDIFEDWLSHEELEVRAAGLFFSIHSTNVTRPMTNGVLKSLKRNLSHLHTDTDANFRRELLGYTQKLFDRLRGSMSSLARLKRKGDASNHEQVIVSVSCFQSGKCVSLGSTGDPLRVPLNFIIWYIGFLKWELRSTSSYQRRITALRALIIVLKSGLDPRVSHHHLSRSAKGQIRWPYGLQIWDHRFIRELLDLVLDPFDDIRSASASILELCLNSSSAQDKALIMAILPQFISRAENAMLRTGRADQADGLARAYSLLFSQSPRHPIGMQEPENSGPTAQMNIVLRIVDQLEETIEVAQNDMSLAVEGRPVHGIFAALRYIIDREAFYSTIMQLPLDLFNRWKSIHDRICGAYDALWLCIRDVLCADAPEGHVPEDMEDETGIDTKEILSYSWRGLKEASILLRTIIFKAPIGAREGCIIGYESFETLSQLCFTQLVDLRHRGAFSAVAQTFAAFCRRCLSTDDKVLLVLPDRWYQETLLCIQDKAGSITRRSAGIPALVSSIIAAESQPGNGSLFARAMKDLIAEALLEAQDSNIEESRLPQVHALNCIKEIFTTSTLSLPSEAYIGECLNLAAKSLNSNIWPIRNSSLVLFKALIHRLLGSDEAQDWKERDRTKTSRFSYQNYPDLAGILSDLLDPNGPLKKSMSTNIDSTSPLDLHGAEGVFPALQILRQAPPPEEIRDIMLKSVLYLVASPHWHLRDMAARTIASLYHPKDDLNTISTLLASIEEPKNKEHGLLLALKYIVKRYLRKHQDSGTGTLDDLLPILAKSSASIFVRSNCPFTKAAYIDLVNLCGIAMLHQGHHYDSPPENWENLTASLGRIGKQGNNSTNSSALLQRSEAQWRAINQAITGYRPGPGLLRLARDDPDTCSVLLETLSEIAHAKCSTDQAYSTALLVQIHLQTLNAEDEEIVSKAQTILADSLANQQRRARFFHSVVENDVMRSLEQLETNCLEGSPSNMQSALHLLGYFVDFSYHNYPHHRRTVLHSIARYIRILRRTIDEENPFDTRFSAAQSLCTLSHIWSLHSTSKSSSPLLLALSIILFDLLNDDDDEIRDAAAVATTRLLLMQPAKPSTVLKLENMKFDPPATIKPAVPILTTYRLAGFLSVHFHTSSSLFAEALCRVIGSPSITQLFSTPFSNTFAGARKEDNALFMVEKRNLFKDDTLDTALWSRILRSMDAVAVPPEYVEGLRNWVMDGLQALTDTASLEEDGALGWTSKVEVFTLGIRVICTAEVLLVWGLDTMGEAKIKIALRKLADVKEGEGIHGLWLEKIESVLENSVLENLKQVYRHLRTV